MRRATTLCIATALPLLLAPVASAASWGPSTTPFSPKKLPGIAAGFALASGPATGATVVTTGAAGTLVVAPATATKAGRTWMQRQPPRSTRLQSMAATFTGSRLTVAWMGAGGTLRTIAGTATAASGRPAATTVAGATTVALSDEGTGRAGLAAWGGGASGAAAAAGLLAPGAAPSGAALAVGSLPDGAVAVRAATDAAGNVTALTLLPSGAVGVATRPAGGAFGASQVLAPAAFGAQPSTFMSLSVDPAGNAAVAFLVPVTDPVLTARVMVATRVGATAAFGQAQQVGDPIQAPVAPGTMAVANCNSPIYTAGPVVAAGPASVAVAWTSTGDFNCTTSSSIGPSFAVTTQMAVATPGQAFPSPTAYADPMGQPSSTGVNMNIWCLTQIQVDVAVNANGQAAAVSGYTGYQGDGNSGDGGNAAIYKVNLLAAAGPGAAATLARRTAGDAQFALNGPQGASSVHVVPSGTGFTAGWQTEGTSRTIFTSTYR